MPQRRAAARRLPAATGRRAPTDTAGFGWLVVTGLRISARVGWDNDAVALDGGLRPSRHTTCRPSRSLPLPRTTPQALWRSVARRHRGSPIPNSPSFFVAEQGGRLPVCTVRATFVPRSRQIGWRGPTARPGPRLHDFRPRCAVQTLGRWYREGVEVARHRPALSTSLGPVTVRDTYWSLSTTPRVPRCGHPTPRAGAQAAAVLPTNRSLPPVGATCCTARRLRQQHASPHTVASDRAPCSWRWHFPQQRRGTAPSALTLGALDAPVRRAFLDALEHQRGTSPRRRHVRRAALHAFFHDAALRVPSQSGFIQRVVAMPRTRSDRRPMACLTAAALDALLAAPDQPTWAGRRART